MPSWETNCIEDWETKIDAIETFDETIIEHDHNLRNPFRCKCILSVCNKKGGKTVGEIFTNFNLFIYGGKFRAL
jgi:hypothetical protein